LRLQLIAVIGAIGRNKINHSVGNILVIALVRGKSNYQDKS